MNILILHQHFNIPQQGGAIRSYYLAKALADAGHTVVVITGSSEPAYSMMNLEGVEVHRLPVKYENRYGFAERSFSFIKYVMGAIRLTGKLKKFDFCYAISVPLTVGIAALWIKYRSNLPYIFEVGDLWPDAPIQMGFVNNYLFAQSLYSLEKRIYKSAHAIVALSPAIKSAIEKKVSTVKVYMIPNMADCDFYKPEKKLPELEQKYKTQGKFVVSYIGAVGVANGLDYFIECANASRKAQLPVQFFLCGDGALLARLKAHADHLMLTNLTFVDFTNRDGVRELMNVTDATFICYKPVSILETGSPNKFFDGLAAGKLIVINFGGWIKNEIENASCGFYTDPHRPTEFVKKITPFVEDKDILRQYQMSARQLAEKKYSRKQLSEQFQKLFQ